MSDIETVKLLTGDSGLSDDFVAFYLQAVREFILNYCNVPDIPQGLHTTYLEMTAMRVKANTSNGAASLGQGIKAVASLSDGNQSVSYSLGGSGTKAFVSEEDLVAAYGPVLDRYRRMVVDHCGPRPLGARCMHPHRDSDPRSAYPPKKGWD